MSLTPNILVSWGMTNSLWSSSLRMGLTFLLGSYGPGLSEAGPGVNRDGISSEFAESSSKTSLERSRLRCGHWNNLIRFPLSHLESVPEAMFKTEFKARPEKEKTWIKRRIVFSPMITWFLLTTLDECYKKYKFKHVLWPYLESSMEVNCEAMTFSGRSLSLGVSERKKSSFSACDLSAICERNSTIMR